MLAYSSVEHMGILVLGMGIGAGGVFASLLHVINHSLAKGMLFLTAGNIFNTVKTKSTVKVRGLAQSLPISAALWIVGFLAISGFPPFNIFVSEWLTLKAAIEQKHFLTAGLFVVFIGLVFVGMSAIVLRMVYGETSHEVKGVKEAPLSILPPMVLGVLVFLLGLWIPPPLSTILKEAAAMLGG